VGELYIKHNKIKRETTAGRIKSSKKVLTFPLWKVYSDFIRISGRIFDREVRHDQIVSLRLSIMLPEDAEAL
jgi:hypothetical protein